MAKKQPLKGCIVTFSGNFYNITQTALLDQAARLGAQTARSVTKAVTHLVTTQTECDKLSSKVRQAQDHGAFIVSIDWVTESEETGSKQPEANFGLTSSPGPTSNGPDLSKKRHASDSPAPDAKKSKLDQLEASEKALPLGKSQVAKDASALRVPLDEGCPLGTYSVYLDDDGVIWDCTLKYVGPIKPIPS